MKSKLLPRCTFKPGTTIATQLYNFLRTQITETGILPDTPLSENELATHFNISRQPVRHALLRLSQDGLIDIQPKRGSFVSKISAKNLEGICFIRTSIEINALRESLSLDDKHFNSIIQKLERNFKQQQDVIAEIADQGMTDKAEAKFLHLDDSFHELICSFSGTPMAWNTIQAIKANMDRIRFLTLDKITTPEDLIEEHQAILQAVSKRDFATAAELMRSHLYTITQSYRAIRAEHSDWFAAEE